MALKYYDRLVRDAQRMSSEELKKQCDKISDEAKRVRLLWDTFIDERAEIMRKLDMLEEPYATVLYLRYVEYRHFQDIASHMNYSYAHITRLHGQALKVFREKFIKHAKKC